MRILARLVGAGAALLVSIPCAANTTDYVTGDGAHVAYLPFASDYETIGAVPGQQPSAAHKHGTAILALSIKQKGVTLEEWDLDAGRSIQERAIGWPETRVQAARAGNVLHIVAAGPKVRYAAVDATTFRVLREVTVGSGDVPAVATDGDVTVVSWHAGRGFENWRAVTLDAQGAILGRVDDSSPDADRSVDTVAVLGGNVYAGEGDAVLRFSRSLRFEKRVQTPPRPFPSYLDVSMGRIVVAVYDGFEELSSELGVVGLYPHPQPLADIFAVDPGGRVVLRRGAILDDVAKPATRHVDFGPGVAMARRFFWIGEVAAGVGCGEYGCSAGIFSWFDAGPRATAH
jgi:hypothetical protein